MAKTIWLGGSGYQAVTSNVDSAIEYSVQHSEA